MCLLATDTELPGEHDDLPECLEKPQSPDLQKRKPRGEQNEESREGREVRLISKCYILDVWRGVGGADLPQLDSEFQVQILYKLFSFPESLSIHTWKPTQILSFQQCQCYLLSPLGICCSVFDNAQATMPLAGLWFNTIFSSKNVF